MAEAAANLAHPADRPVAGNRLRVLLPLPLPAALDYLAPEGAPAPAPGTLTCIDRVSA